MKEIGKAISVKHAVMQTMFCPTCGAVLDMRRAVEVAVYAGGKLLAVSVACAPCHDEKWPLVKKTIDDNQDRGIRAEISDGRTINWPLLGPMLT